MRKIAAMLAFLWACPAVAAGSPELQGYWQLIPTVAESRDYVAAVVIDAEGRATYDAPMDNRGGAASFRGYVAMIGPEGAVQMVLTDGERVAKVHCRIEAQDTMRCRSHRDGGTISAPYLLKRIRKGVGKLNE